jgi:wobble nucleotide-excising tRNase
MITDIKIKNTTSYHPTEETVIKELKKVNFFFGNNGSGKSTIAKYLYNESVDSEDKSSSFDNCTQNGFVEENHQILVFDEKFIQRNFIDNDIQSGIFSLNETNEEIDKLIKVEQEIIKSFETYKDEILVKRIEGFQKQKLSSYKKLKDYCFNKRKSTIQSFLKIKDDFPRKQTQNNYDEINAVRNIIGPKPSISFDKLSTDYKKYYDTDLQKIDVYLEPIFYRTIRKKEVQLNKLLQEVIVGNDDVDIAKLINDLGIKSWVENGITFLNDDDTKTQTCPFCQNETIDKALLDKFGQYFDESYKKKIEDIENLQIEYRLLFEEYLVKINNLNQVYNIGNVVSNLYTKIKGLFDNNIELIEDKIKKSNEKKELVSLFGFKKDIVNINLEIETHNKDFENLDKNKENFLENIWFYLANETSSEIEKHKDREIYDDFFTSVISQSETITDKILESKQKIDEWREDTVSTKKAIENINTILKNSGFKGFQIEEKELDENKISQYYLKRDDTSNVNVFKSLSEGEKNFIAFLYFYQLCLGSDTLDNEERKKIIVIDDPASSIDSQSIFIISSLIHQLIARKGSDNRPNKREFLNTNICQVFIFTHNIFFYKEVTLDNLRGSTNRQFYLVSKFRKYTEIEIKADKEISNDYSLMWSSLKRIKLDVSDGNKDYNILIGNVMRRILESYVNFTGIGKRVWDSVKDVNPEDTRNIICSSLISEINDTSHKVSPLDDIYFTRIVNLAPNNLFDVFKLIFKEIGKEHYEIMMNEIIEEEVEEAMTAE